jgi:PAS domain S-box-containing protein
LQSDETMSWVTVIWSVGGGACLTLAFLQFIVWWKDRAARANLVFSVGAIAVAVFAALELALMRAETVAQFATITRWIHVPGWVLIVSIVAFVRLYLNAGRRWLAWSVVAVRTLSLILNFVLSPNINYRNLTGLRHVPFLGESVSLPAGVPNPWMLVAQFSLLLLVIFVVDATIAVWRRGNRRQALVVGGSVVLLVVLASAQAVAMTWGIVAMPLMVSLFYLILVAAMAYELSYDLIRAAKLTRQLQASEATLRETEEGMSLAVKAAGLIIWTWDIARDEVWLPDKDRALFGFSPSEKLTAERIRTVVHPEDGELVRQLVENSLTTEEEIEAQYRVILSDGSVRWMSRRGRVEFDGDGKPMCERGVLVDITQLVKNEEALREFEERVVLAAEAAHLGVWELDIATNELWMSDSARSLFQLDSETHLSAAGLQDRVHPEDRALRDSAVKSAIETQGEYEIEYRVLLPDGTSRWIGGRGRCVPRGNGKGTRLIGVSMDITPRKEVQDLFRLATEASPSGIVLVNDRGRIVLVNSHVEKLFGYRREELVGKLVDILVPERFAGQHPAHRAQFLAAPAARAMGAGRELFARRKDGSEFPVEIGLNPIETPNGILVLAAVVDISARKLADAEVTRYRADLGHLSRVAVMGELAASIAHELNQPLSGIISNASAGRRFIDRGDVDLNELRELLTDIIADGRRAGDVIRGIRSMVKKEQTARERVDLNDVIKNVLRLVSPDALLRSCELKTSLAQNLPRVEADPTQLQQVLLNLVMNAFEAMRDTPVSRREVVIATERSGDGTICTSVRDYGVGISDEVRERLFDHFFTTKREGLGMGLGIVRSIVEAHGGIVTAENVEGGGAQFRFTIPTNAATS